MNKSDAAKKLKYLVEKYLVNDPDRAYLGSIIDDPQRPLPIRGVLDHMGKYRGQPYTVDDRGLIDELLYHYG